MHTILTDFFGGAIGEPLKWEGGRWYVVLPGKGASMFRGVGGFNMEPREERWIEVFAGENYWSFMTRQHDEYTNVLADGLAQHVARFYQGKFER
jgi:hypothetical protein